MRTTMIVIATLGAAALPGCLVETRRSPGHARVETVIEVEHTYTYFPSAHAYFCEETDEWWIIEGGAWTMRRSRPVNIIITRETPWVVVNIRGSRPNVRFQEHARSYPSHWRPEKDKGPPPGRGWDRRDGDDRKADDGRRGDDRREDDGKRAAANQRAEDDRRKASEKRADDDRKAAAGNRADADRKAAALKRVRDEKETADLKRAHDDKRAADEKRAHDEKKAADLKRAHDEKKAADEKRADDERKDAGKKNGKGGKKDPDEKHGDDE